MHPPSPKPDRGISVAHLRHATVDPLDLGEPPLVQYWKWLVQIFWIEPKVFIDWMFGTQLAWHWETPTFAPTETLLASMQEAGRVREVNGEMQFWVPEQRNISWQTRSPVMDIIIQRIVRIRV